MTPAELLAAAKANIEAAVAEEVKELLRLVRERLQKDPYAKGICIKYAYRLDDVVARGAEWSLGQLGYRARFVRRLIFSDYMEISGWQDAASPTPDRGPYRKTARVTQSNEDDFGF